MFEERKQKGKGNQSTSMVTTAAPRLPAAPPLQRQQPTQADQAIGVINAHTWRPIQGQQRVLQPVQRALSLHAEEVSRVDGERAALQRQIAEHPPVTTADIQQALQRLASGIKPVPIVRQPKTVSDWVTVMRQQAEQAEGRRMSSRESMQFSALQRQISQTLTQSYLRDRQPPLQRQQEYAQHIVALQRHPLSGLVGQVFMRSVPAGERPALQRAVDDLTQQETLQREQDEQALQLHSLQRQLADLEQQATLSVTERIQQRRGTGNPLPEAIQRHLEQGLNHDLSAVRIHDDAEADKLAKSVNAIAFTTGTDIFFQSGKYDPNSKTGLELLAHEVTHTVQQSKGQVGKGIDPDAGLEQEARHMGRVLARAPRIHTSGHGLRTVAAQTARVTGALQRQAATDDPAFLKTLTSGQAPSSPFAFVWHSDGGVKIRETIGGKELGIVRNTTRLQLLRYDPKQKAYAVRSPSGVQGWVADSHLKVPPPQIAQDAGLRFYVPKDGEGIFAVVGREYGATEFGEDARYFTNVLRAVNQPAAFMVKDPKYKGFLEAGYERVVTAMTEGRDANGVGLKKVTPFWLPSPAAAKKIKAPSGSFSKQVLDTTKATFGEAGEQALYGGLFMTGLQVGLLKSLWDAIVGLVELVKLPVTVVKSIYNVIQTALQGQLLNRVQEIYAFIAGGGLKQIADMLVGEFKAGWDHKNPLKAWEFRGQVIGYVATEIITTFIPIAGIVLKAAKAGKVVAFLSSKFKWIGEAGKKAMAMLDKVKIKWPPPGMSPQMAVAGGLNISAPQQEVSLGTILRKAGTKVMDAAGLPIKRVLNNRDEIIEALYKKYPNFNAVKAIVGTTVDPDHPPLGYLYAKLPFNGKTYEYLYLPNVGDGKKVPLLVIKNGKVEFDAPTQLTLTKKVDSKGVEFEDPSYVPSARMASMYAQGYVKVLGKGESQLHHLIADNLARNNAFFQEAMKRGLFGMDEKLNIIEIAENDTALKKAQQMFKSGKTSTELPPLVHRGPHGETDQVTQDTIELILRRNGIDISLAQDIKSLSDSEMKLLIKEIQDELREMYRKNQMPTKNGNQLALGESAPTGTA